MPWHRIELSKKKPLPYERALKASSGMDISYSCSHYLLPTDPPLSQELDLGWEHANLGELRAFLLAEAARGTFKPIPGLQI